MRPTAATGHRDDRGTYEPLRAPSEPWWPKPVQERQLLECSCASPEWVLFRGLKSASSPGANSKIEGLYACAARLNAAVSRFGKAVGAGCTARLRACIADFAMLKSADSRHHLLFDHCVRWWQAGRTVRTSRVDNGDRRAPCTRCNLSSISADQVQYPADECCRHKRKHREV
jgi:hypothetical protein